MQFYLFLSNYEKVGNSLMELAHLVVEARKILIDQDFPQSPKPQVQNK